jgi:hypothetical protein
VLAAPKQAFESPALRDLVVKFVEENYGPHRHNPQFYFRTTFQVGRSLAQQDVHDFVSSLNLPPPDENIHPRAITRWWYPRLWDRWARLETEEKTRSFFSEEREVSLKSEDSTIELRALGPPFGKRSRLGPTARFANELAYRVYGAEDPVAEVLPHGSRQLAMRVSGGALENFRLSRSGPVHLGDRNDTTIYFSIPKAEYFMLCWFWESGWKAEMSQAGLITKQMLKRLGGSYGTHLINHEEVLKLLDKHASEKIDPTDSEKPRSPKWIEETVLNAEISKILSKEGGHMERDRYLSLLREKDVIRLGLQLHSPTCTRWLWKAIGDLSDQVECDQCLTKFSVSAASPDDRKWSFKPIGPFNVRAFASGAYTALLSWQFIAGLHHRTTTPIMSVNVERGGVKQEIDLALFCNDGGFRAPTVELLLVECKSYDAFGPRDVSNMQRAGEQHPEAILIFAKLGQEFNASELRLLARLVNRQRRLWLAQRPHNAVLILTGTELFGQLRFPRCWEGKGGKFDQAYANRHTLRTLRQLAEVTQGLYLGVPQLHVWAKNQPSRGHRAAEPIFPAPPPPDRA